jgi:hypothetical protein
MVAQELGLEHCAALYQQDLEKETHCGLDERLFLDNDPTVRKKVRLQLEACVDSTL